MADGISVYVSHKIRPQQRHIFTNFEVKYFGIVLRSFDIG
jgi:hypothetical protein